MTASGNADDLKLIETSNVESHYSVHSSAEGLQNLKNESIYLSNIKNTSKDFNIDDSKRQILIDGNKFEKKKQRVIYAIEQESSIIRFVFYGMLKIFSKPWEILLQLIMPTSNEGIILYIKFLIPIFIIWNVCDFELYLLEKIIKKFNLNANFVGLTITAWGNISPDLFTTISAMERGMVDLGINNCISSQVNDALLGLGLPWLVYNLKFDKPLTLTSGGTIYAFSLSYNVLFILLLIIVLKINKTKLDSKIATFFFVVYALYLIILYLLIVVFKKNI